jgi:hypothetical protein
MEVPCRYYIAAAVTCHDTQPSRRSPDTPGMKHHEPLPLASFEFSPHHHVLEFPDTPDGTALEAHVHLVLGCTTVVWQDQDGRVLRCVRAGRG